MLTDMEVMLLKQPGGVMSPMGDEDAETLTRIKTGSVVKCKVSEMRNGHFFRKWWSLVKLAYDLACEHMQPYEHKGMQVAPCFDEFRKDITILAGYHEATFKWDGTIRLKAQSLKWSQMTEETFTQLYSATINVVLQKVLPNVNEQDFKRALEQTMAYA